MGYDTNLFVQQPVHESLLCHICYSVLEDPTTVCMEGHVYCLSCVEEWELRSASCPECRSVMRMNDEKIHNLPIKNITMSLMVRCSEIVSRGSGGSDGLADTFVAQQDSNDNGIHRCSWQGTLAEYLQHHYRKCIHCPLGCGGMIRVCHVEQHQHYECPRRIISCSRCKSTMARNEYPRHSMYCRPFPTTPPLHLPLITMQCNHVKWIFPQSVLVSNIAQGCTLAGVCFESEYMPIKDDKQSAAVCLIVKNNVVHARVCIKNTYNPAPPTMERLSLYNQHACMVFDDAQTMKTFPGRPGIYWAGGPLQCPITTSSTTSTKSTRRRPKLRDVTLQDLVEWQFEEETFVLEGNFHVQSMEFEA